MGLELGLTGHPFVKKQPARGQLYCKENGEKLRSMNACSLPSRRPRQYYNRAHTVVSTEHLEPGTGLEWTRSGLLSAIPLTTHTINMNSAKYWRTRSNMDDRAEEISRTSCNRQSSKILAHKGFTRTIYIRCHIGYHVRYLTSYQPSWQRH